MPAPQIEPTPDLLEAEARIFGRYLLGREPAPELCRRYAWANRTLLPTSAPAREQAVTAFAVRHPWSVSWLDAGSGLLAPRGLLRTKLLILAAVLETSPELADEFLPRSTSLVPLVARLAALGCLGALQAGLGLLLVPIAARS